MVYAVSGDALHRFRLMLDTPTHEGVERGRAAIQGGKGDPQRGANPIRDQQVCPAGSGGDRSVLSWSLLVTSDGRRRDTIASMVASAARLVRRAAEMAVKPGASDEDRMASGLFLLMAAASTLAGALWGIGYALLGRPLSALIPGGFALSRLASPAHWWGCGASIASASSCCC